MTLSKEVYQALENIVGNDNISDDPAVLDSYAFQWLAELCQGSKFINRPEAVILPGSTGEVQAIVKTCNRYKIKIHAYSTGWGPWGGTQTEGVIQLDMRRMNRILEIDEQNMYAVVEPYVVCAQLQAEAMKVGLNTHMIGAGASCAVITACGIHGQAGPDTIFMGHGTDNMLGLEWIMPDGEILRTGTLGSDIGWFYGEGPGPSLRGMARGSLGHLGGFGVFTKCAVKLHPWPGPAILPVEGVPPSYESPLPENIRAYTVAFPTWQAMSDAYYKIYESEIGYIAHRQFIKWGDELQVAVVNVVTDPAKQLCDIDALLKKPEIKKLTAEMKRSFQIVLAGMSPRDIEYQDKALDEILAETQGWKVEAMSTPHMERWTLLYMIRLCFKNMNWLLSGSWTDACIIIGTPDMVFTSGVVEAASELQRQTGQKVVEHGGDSMMGGVAGLGPDGGTCAVEPFIFYDPHDAASCQSAIEISEAGAGFTREWGFSFAGNFPLLHRNFNRAMLADIPAFHWQRKIKEVFDPNDVGDWNFMYAEEPGK